MADKEVEAYKNLIKFKQDRQDYKDMQAMQLKHYPNQHLKKLKGLNED
jgi:hypothetical protein